MWYISLSGGMSHTALCEALLKLIEDNNQHCIDVLCGYVKKNKILYEKGCFKEKAQLDLLFLREKLKAMQPLDVKEAKELADDMALILDDVISLAGEKAISPFNVVVYLLLFILLEKLHLKTRIKLLPLRMSPDSQENAFHILKGIKVVLDPLAPFVSPMCAAFCKYYADLFTDHSSGILISFRKIVDPLNRNIRVRLFEYDEWKTHRDTDGYDYDVIGVLETNIDDCTPEVISGAMIRILKAGALDYTITPVIMKKGRNGFHIQVLCRKNDSKMIAEELLVQTSSFGLRMYTSLRTKLKRKIEKIQTAYGEVRVKIGYKGNTIIKAVPEFDDLNKISETQGVPFFNLYNEIMAEIKKGIDCFRKDDKIIRL